MKLTSSGIAHGERIPSRYAFGKHDAKAHVALCENLSPSSQGRKQTSSRAR